ncbi:MAG: hypothetical protein JNM43_22225 [Planctomycetaceae bacterium]|nr:hypothetical protein [Planctomycetaceae bacterium]
MQILSHIVIPAMSSAAVNTANANAGAVVADVQAAICRANVGTNCAAASKRAILPPR